jgi:hypothetical protein
VFVTVTAGLTVGVVVAEGIWQDIWLSLLAEAAGAAFIVLFVDQLIERSKERDRDERRRAAVEDLRFVLRDLQKWLVGLFLRSDSAITHHEDAHDADRVPVEALVTGLPRHLGTIDFAAAGPYKRDRYFVEWARRSFDQTALELARWERNFAGSGGIFGDDFRSGAERLHSFIRATGSFLEGMERYIVRENPSSPVFAYQGITELTEEDAGRLESQLRDFLDFDRGQCKKYNATAPEFDVIFEPARAPSSQ